MCFISDLHIYLITGLAGLKIWNNTNYLPDLTLENDLYWAIYLGISWVLALLRIDLSYTSQKYFRQPPLIGHYSNSDSSVIIEPVSLAISVSVLIKL